MASSGHDVFPSFTKIPELGFQTNSKLENGFGQLSFTDYTAVHSSRRFSTPVFDVRAVGPFSEKGETGLK
jgi:hypothetical protein